METVSTTKINDNLTSEANRQMRRLVYLMENSHQPSETPSFKDGKKRGRPDKYETNGQENIAWKTESSTWRYLSATTSLLCSKVNRSKQVD